ncbi:MAG: type III pantothenate kinase [Chromatocurvus sp.]
MMVSDGAVLQVDLGNSGLKWRLVTDDGVHCRGVQALRGRVGGELQLPDIRPAAVLVSSVAAHEIDQQLAAQIRQQWSLEPWFARSEAETLGLRNSYRQPEHMGVDRWLAMLGAWHPWKERVCVVDAGSALTIDIVAADGRHEGGYILPGVALMQRALRRDTQRVRFDQTPAAVLAPGRSTAEAVGHGTALAQCGAVRLAVELASAGHGMPPRVVLAGGGGQMLSGLLGGELQWRRDLVFEGLELAAAAANVTLNR